MTGQTGSDPVFPTGSPTSLYIYTSPTTFNTQTPHQRSTFFNIDFTAKSDLITFTGPGILDSGSNVTVLPVKSLSPHAKSQLVKSNTQGNIDGVGGRTPVLGHFDATLHAGTLVLPNIRFLVVDQDIPCLLGHLPGFLSKNGRCKPK